MRIFDTLYRSRVISYFSEKKHLYSSDNSYSTFICSDIYYGQSSEDNGRLYACWQVGKFIGKFIINFATVLLGTLIFSLIYLDDFKAKSSSAIISCGESRNLFVFSKQVISVIVTILAYAVMMGVFFIGAAVLGYVFTGEQMTELVFSAFGSILTVLG